MIRGPLLTTALFFLAFDPVPVTVADPLERALTNGGLFGVVLVLLWYIRSLHKERISEKENSLTEKDEKLQAMITLATEVKVALTQSIAAAAALSRTVEKMEDRRGQ